MLVLQVYESTIGIGHNMFNTKNIHVMSMFLLKLVKNQI